MALLRSCEVCVRVCVCVCLQVSEVMSLLRLCEAKLEESRTTLSEAESMVKLAGWI
jgi:hypothetical protein